MRKELLMLDLGLFGEGTGAPAEAEGEQTDEADRNDGQNRAETLYKKSSVQSGEFPQDAVEEKGHEPASQKRAAEFEGLIKGKYRDLFHARVQEIIDRRFGETKDLKKRMEQAQPLIDRIADRYGVDASDLQALTKAVEEDSMSFEQEAAEKGMPVYMLKEMKQMEHENARLRAAREAERHQQQAYRVYGEWMQQAQQIKELYPDFDFQTEIDNPQFLSLLKAPGVDVRTAYEVVHRDEIIGGAMQHTAQAVAQKMVNNLAVRGTRPPEIGASGQSAVTFKSDVESLSKDDLKEIWKRVGRGERIAF